MILRNGSLEPGRIHTLLVSTFPINRTYRKLNGIMVDVNLRNMGLEIARLLSDENFTHLSLKRNNVVEGRSWEMSVTKSILDEKGMYSGVLQAYDGLDNIEYGAVPAIDIKRKLYNGDRKSVV